MNDLAVSKIVRAVMQAHGKQRIYNNLYPSMRSVKCYAGEGSRDAVMCDDLAKVLRTQGVNFEIKRKIVKHRGWGPFSSIIVRIFR